MEDYTLLQTWKPTGENDFKDMWTHLDDNPDMSYFGRYNSLKEVVGELEYQGLDFKEIVQLTKNRYGNVVEIIEYDSAFYVFIGAN